MLRERGLQPAEPCQHNKGIERDDSECSAHSAARLRRAGSISRWRPEEIRSLDSFSPLTIMLRSCSSFRFGLATQVPSMSYI
jgi:hypothetical protein